MARSSTTWTKATASRKGGTKKGTRQKRTIYKEIAKIMYEQDEDLFDEIFFSTEALSEKTINKKLDETKKFSLWQKMQIMALYKAVSKGDSRAVQGLKEQFVGKPKEHTQHSISGDLNIIYDAEATKVLAKHFIKKYRKIDRGR